MKKEEIKYVPCIPQPCTEDDEIDLKEIIKTILKYKKFILFFTLTVTLIAAIYSFIAKPVYEIKAYIQLGEIATKSINNEELSTTILNPYSVIIYIKNQYSTKTYPKVNASIEKKAKNIIKISIQDYYNPNAIKVYKNILQSIKNQENKKISNIKNLLISSIKTLKQQEKKDPKNYLKYEEQIINLKYQLASITNTTQIGNILKSNSPIKPKRKLIITIAFVTSFILSIFIIFFIEFIKSLREE